MSISDNYIPVKESGDGGTVDFGANWAVLVASYLKVYLENKTTGVQVLQTITTDYTLVFNESGFTVTFVVAPPNTEWVVINREAAQDQTDPYKTSKGWQGDIVENSFDKLTVICQDQQDEINRAPKLPIGSTVNPTLPLPSAGKALLWNVTEDALENSTDDFNDIVTDATAQADIAIANAALTAADVVTTNADVVLTNADVVLTNADVVLTGLDVIATGNDVAATNADVVLTNADVVLTGLDVIQTGIDAAAAAASAAAADVAKIEWQGTYNAGTAYVLNDAVTYLGSSFINIQAGTGQTPAVGGTAYWDDLSNKGDTGSLGDIAAQTPATVAVGDEVVFADVDDSDNTKKDTVQGLIDLVPADLLGKADTVITASDKIIFGDASDSDNPKTDTVDGVADVVVGSARTFTGAQKPSETALTSTAASIAVDFSANNDFTHTFTENTTLANPTNITVGQSGAIRLTQHASSPKTLAFGSYWDFTGGTAPTVTATNSARDTLFYHVRSATLIETSWVGNWG